MKYSLSTNDTPSGKSIIGDLVNLDDRKKWEQQFDDCYISNVLKVIHLTVSILNYYHKGH